MQEIQQSSSPGAAMFSNLRLRLRVSIFNLTPNSEAAFLSGAMLSCAILGSCMSDAAVSQAWF